MASRSRSDEEKFWGSLAHYAIFLTLPLVPLPGPLPFLLGPSATLGVYFLKRNRSRWIAFQAIQSLVYQTIYLVILLFFLWSTRSFEDVDAILRGRSFTLIIMGISLLYGFLAGFRCLLGHNFKYLFLGRFLERFMRVQEE